MRGLHTMLWMAGVGLVLILAACTGSPDLPTGTPGGAAPPVGGAPTPLPAGTLAPGAAGKPPMISNADSGKQLTLQVGQTLAVQLNDRLWADPAVDPKVLELQPSDVPITQGVYYWLYKALAPGTTELTSQGACIPNNTGIQCNSIILYKVTITVQP